MNISPSICFFFQGNHRHPADVDDGLGDFLPDDGAGDFCGEDRTGYVPGDDGPGDVRGDDGPGDVCGDDGAGDVHGDDGVGDVRGDDGARDFHGDDGAGDSCNHDPPAGRDDNRPPAPPVRSPLLDLDIEKLIRDACLPKIRRGPTPTQLRRASQLISEWAPEFERIFYQRRVDRIPFIRPCAHLTCHLPSEAAHPYVLHSGQWNIPLAISAKRYGNHRTHFPTSHSRESAVAK